MLFDMDAAREIHLVFMDTHFKGDEWLKDGFKHVYAIERQALGWICSDPSKSDLHSYILPAHYESEVIEQFKINNPSFTVLSLKVKPHYNSVFPRFGLISCVSLMQYILGVYWPFVFTPYQLYTKIINQTPNHIEVIACHDTRFTELKEKQKRQLRKQKP
jgi:hypothetical protein